MCEIVKLTMLCVKDKINIFERKFCYEIFGYDFILDDEFRPYLLEVNTNPGLEESSPLIKMLVPRMIDDALRLTVDDVFNSKYNFDMSEGYQSPFTVDNVKNSENMWDYICHFRDKTEVVNNKSTFRKK